MVWSSFPHLSVCMHTEELSLWMHNGGKYPRLDQLIFQLLQTIACISPSRPLTTPSKIKMYLMLKVMWEELEMIKVGKIAGKMFICSHQYSTRGTGREWALWSALPCLATYANLLHFLTLLYYWKHVLLFSFDTQEQILVLGGRLTWVWRNTSGKLLSTIEGMLNVGVMILNLVILWFFKD